MEKRLIGLNTRFIQNVYNITFEEEKNDYIAIKKNGINKSYNVFNEDTWIGNRGLLQEVSHISSIRKPLNERKLFEKFVSKWGFISNSDKQSMKEFWDEVNKIALLLTRYSQIMNKNLPALKSWITLKEARREIYEVINGVEYRIENTETMSAKRGSRTMVSYSGDIKIGSIETDASLSDIKDNQLASYQLFGFIFLTEALYDQEIQSCIRPGRISVNQRNIYTPMEKPQVEPYLEIK